MGRARLLPTWFQLHQLFSVHSWLPALSRRHRLSPRPPSSSQRGEKSYHHPYITLARLQHKHPAKNCPLWSLPLSHNPPHHPQTQSATKSRARCPNQIRVASWSACSLCLELAHRTSCIVRSLWGIKSLRRGTARCTSKGDSCGSSSGLRVLGLRVDEDRLRV
jgi:hypothetical protein